MDFNLPFFILFGCLLKKKKDENRQEAFWVPCSLTMRVLHKGNKSEKDKYCVISLTHGI